MTGASGTMASVNPLRYRGYYYDSETGFYYLNSRYYDPQIGRFINADLAEYAELSAGSVEDTNLFAYCGNNPVNSDDEDGELVNIAIGAVVGATFGAVFKLVDIAMNPNTNWKDRKTILTELGKAAVSGAVTGALSSVGLPSKGATVALGAVVSGVDTLREALSECKKGQITPMRAVVKVAASAAVGAVSSAIGYSGATSTKLTKDIFKAAVKRCGKGVTTSARNNAVNALSRYGRVIANALKSSYKMGGISSAASFVVNKYATHYYNKRY